ncbi:MAG: hypothetical protein ABI151_02030 [Chitinophagaceae bacterium]
MISKSLLSFFFCVLFGSGFLYSQKIDSMMNIYQNQFPQEKIYVHFDKAYYNPGETVWFKAYVMSGINLSDISKNFYAELINNKGEVIQRIVAPVLYSSASSSFVIPKKYTSQYVHFRAFTSWMLNFDTSFLFDKNIRIVNPAIAAEPAVRANSSLIQFFPEGGDLIADIESNLAFKANDQYGFPVRVSGSIKAADGKKVADFKSVHDGMGVLKFQPVKGQTYSAFWKDSTGKEIITPIPDAKPGGLVLTATNTPGSVTFVVKRSDKGEDLKQIVLIGHMDQQMVYKAKINLSQNFLSSGRIPVDQFPSGILQLTAFNSNMQPIAERIIFVNNNDYLFDAYFRSLLKDTKKRGKNVVEIEIPDTTLTNLSMSITDANVQSTTETDDNIYSHLLVTSELKGYVHNPGYYFAGYADSVTRHLDLVMLTHGWRRFNWQDLAAGKFPQIRFAPDNYLTLKGTVVSGSGGTLAGETQVNLIMQLKDSSKQFLSVPLLPGGKYTTEPMLFYDTAKVFYQLNKSKKSPSNIILTIENGFLHPNQVVKIPESMNQGNLVLDNTTLANSRKIYALTQQLEVDRQKKAKMLDEVIVRARTKTAAQKLEDQYTSGLFKGGDGYSFDIAGDPSAMGSQSLFNYLQGRVAGLQISNATSGNPTLSWRGGSPDIYLDEIKTDASQVSSLSMADIAFVKVFRPPFFGSAGGGSGGAIAVYTKKGGPSNNTDFVGLSKVSITGYSQIREFYSPNYSVSDPLHDLDDIRTTLYWEPYIFLDKEKKKKSITFYNNDISRRLRVIIEGVNEHGKLTRVESFIE